MKVFNGKQASEDYMSMHTLAFSTPELTLTRFAFWLGDIVPDPKDREQTVPRIMTFVEEKDFEPVQIIDDNKYIPSGAVKEGGLYGTADKEIGTDGKFCPECGAKNSPTSKFCTECGTTQD